MAPARRRRHHGDVVEPPAVTRKPFVTADGELAARRGDALDAGGRLGTVAPG